MGTGTQFAADISKWVEKAKGDTDAVVRRVLIDLSYKVVVKTPVEYGRARGNWQFCEGEAPEGETGDLDSTGVNAISTMGAQIATIKAGKVYRIFNNAPYIGLLEWGGYPLNSTTGKTAGGFSTQAPQGMARLSMMEVVAELK
jgi:hypothetical protein